MEHTVEDNVKATVGVEGDGAGSAKKRQAIKNKRLFYSNFIKNVKVTPIYLSSLLKT